MKPNIPFYKDQFMINPDVIFLNHGSFGTTSRFVFENYQKWQRELEFQPVEFLGRRQKYLLEESRSTLASYLGTNKNNIVYVPNTTIGLNIIAHSVAPNCGEEVVTSDHEYGAMDRMWRFMQNKKGFTYQTREIPLPLASADLAVESLWRGISPKTKIIFISHITSPTALLFPVQEICKRARSEGIITIIDGAHAPGHVDLRLDDLGADFYVGNLHKWLCAPKGSGFIYAHPSVQEILEPLVVSWGWQSDNPGESSFVDTFEYVGTRDLAAYLAVPSAIAYQTNNDWHKVREYCHFLAMETQKRIEGLTGIPSINSNSSLVPLQMATATLPRDILCDALQKRLYEEFSIEIPVYEWNSKKLIRFSFQAYNDDRDMSNLVDALRLLLEDPNLRN